MLETCFSEQKLLGAPGIATRSKDATEAISSSFSAPSGEDIPTRVALISLFLSFSLSLFLSLSLSFT